MIRTFFIGLVGLFFIGLTIFFTINSLINIIDDNLLKAILWGLPIIILLSWFLGEEMLNSHQNEK